MRFWDWLLRRKREPENITPEENMRRALAQLDKRHAYYQKKGWIKKHHIDDFRELKAESKPEELSENLLYLTADTYQHRHLYASEEDKKRVSLNKELTDDGAMEASRASEEAIAEMQKKGIKLTENYYKAAERKAAGEVQETYDVGTKQEPSE